MATATKTTDELLRDLAEACDNYHSTESRQKANELDAEAKRIVSVLRSRGVNVNC